MTDRSQALGAASMYHLLRERRLRERAAAQPQRGGQRRTIAGPPRASGDAATAASGEALPAGLPAAGKEIRTFPLRRQREDNGNVWATGPD